jgi:hypothetical protein
MCCGVPRLVCQLRKRQQGCAAAQGMLTQALYSLRHLLDAHVWTSRNLRHTCCSELLSREYRIQIYNVAAWVDAVLNVDKTFRANPSQRIRLVPFSAQQCLP